jgi:hypothetical protein
VLQVAWKLSNVKVLCSVDAGKDDHTVTVAVASAASRMLHAREPLPVSALSVLRKAYDPRPPRKGNHKQQGPLTTVQNPTHCNTCDPEECKRNCRTHLRRLLLAPSAIGIASKDAVLLVATSSSDRGLVIVCKGQEEKERA